jgi:hypothetical protein
MARRSTQTLDRPAPTVAVPERVSRRTLALWMPIVLMVLLGLGILITLAILPDNAPAAQPEQQTGVEEIVPPVEENPPAQTKPSESGNEVVAPAAPVVVDYRVVWTEVQGFDPFTIPVENELYSGTMGDKWNSTAILEAQAYALKVYPELEGIAGGFDGATAAVTRDSLNKNFVLLSVFATYDEKREEGGFKREARIALSVDGEKSWCNLNVLPYEDGDAGDVRIRVNGSLITLFGQDADVGYRWWTTTVDKNALPCS